MLNFDKDEIKQQITENLIFELLDEWGGAPQYTDFGIMSATICHNPIGEGSHKLYYYRNSGLFQCWTNCGTFDLLDLIIKIAKIQWRKEYNLNDAIRWVAYRFGLSVSTIEEDKESLEDWYVLNNYDKIQKKDEENKKNIILPEYDNSILSNLNYQVKISPWLEEGITQETLKLAEIGYLPSTDQITIPHFDADNRFIGLRGRTVCKDEAELYGKYRPIRINRKMYNHPLGFNLYGLNWNKENIKAMKTAIVFESEKSVLKYGSFFGNENNISVACCGSNLSLTQVNLLLDLDIKEIVLAFDKQFKQVGDEEAKLWEKKLRRIHDKYENEILISIIWDKGNLLGYKDSPIDKGKDVYLKLFKERIIL